MQASPANTSSESAVYSLRQASSFGLTKLLIPTPRGRRPAVLVSDGTILSLNRHIQHLYREIRMHNALSAEPLVNFFYFNFIFLS